MTTYLETFRAEAETKIGPLANRVAELTKHLDGIRRRAAAESENAGRIAADVADLKRLAGESLTGDTNAYERFKTSLKKLTAKLETSQEIGATFTREIIPTKEREIAAARLKLAEALAALYAEKKPACEAEMTRLLDAVVAERDAFLTAFGQLFSDFGVGFTGGARGIPPRAAHGRISSIERRMTGGAKLVFTDRPAPTPQAPGPVVATVPQAQKPRSPAAPSQDTPLDEIVDSTGQEPLPNDVADPNGNRYPAGPDAAQVNSPEGQERLNGGRVLLTGETTPAETESEKESSPAAAP